MAKTVRYIGLCRLPVVNTPLGPGLRTLLAGGLPVTSAGCPRARQPPLALGVQSLHPRAGEPGQVPQYRIADLLLEVGRVPVAGREAGQQCRVELQLRRRVDHVQPVLLVDGLPPDDAPAAVPPLQEVLEAAAAGHGPP